MPKINLNYKRIITRFNKCEWCNKWPLYYSIRTDKYFCWEHKKLEEKELENGAKK